MNSEILHKMEERRICKNMKAEEQYKRLKNEIRKLCREAKDKYYEDKCKEIEMLDKAHSQLMYQKIKELRPKGNSGLQTIRGKQGNVLMEKYEVMERWAEYVEELYRNETRGEDASIDKSRMESEVYTISSEEIEAVISDLPKGKACGSDNISAELLQCMAGRGVQIISGVTTPGQLWAMSRLPFGLPRLDCPAWAYPMGGLQGTRPLQISDHRGPLYKSPPQIFAQKFPSDLIKYQESPSQIMQ